MKIDNLNDKEVFNNLETTSHKFNISKQGQQFIIDALSNTIYKNPIGTIIREYVSNAHDANVEAGSTQPVVVNLGKDSNGNFLSVVDLGVGLSEERISTVFVNYGESTKRNNDNEIGGFGIGAKSAFSYADTFFVNTVVGGFVYKYILMKTNHEPEMQLISKDENVDNLPIGTEIKIYIKEGDVLKFKNEIYNQLRYFDEVFVQDELAFNEFKIKEFNTFKFSTQAVRNDKFQKLHICLGKVSYPIDFNLLGVNNIEIPFALKFNIGELKVTLSREELQYDDQTKEAIKAKIKLFKEEISTLYLEQKFEFINFGEFQKRSESNPSITVEKNFTFKINGFLSNVKKPLKLKQLPFLDSNTFPEPYFFLKCDRQISESGNFVLHENYKYNSEKRLDEQLLRYAVFLPKDYKRDRVTNLYLQSIGKDYIIEERSLNYSKYVSYLRLRPTHKSIEVGKNNTKRIKLYKTVIFQEFFKSVLNYKNVVVPKEFHDAIDSKNKNKADEKKRLKALEPKVDVKGVEVYNVSNRSGKGFSKTYVDFTKFKVTIVLGKKEDCEAMSLIQKQYSQLNITYRFYCLTSNKKLVDLLKIKNVVSIEDFKNKFKLGRETKVRFVNEFILETIDIDDLTLFPLLRKHLDRGNLRDTTYKFIKDEMKLNPNNFMTDEIRFQINKVKRFQKIFPYGTKIANNFYVNYQKIFDLKIQETEDTLQFRRLLSKHGLYPGNNAYVPICHWEHEFIKQNENKVKYLQSLNN